MKETLNNFLGYQCPFFLGNKWFGEEYYQYQIYSPGLDEKLNPYFSLFKISEKTKNNTPNGQGSDIIASLLGTKRKITKTCSEYISDMMKKDEPVVVPKDSDFPWITMEPGGLLQKSLIIGLRDSLRWKMYKFFPGRMIDVLWTEKEYVVFNINGSKEDETLWLEPVAVYSLSDPEMRNPLPVKPIITKEKFTGPGKISDLNRYVKRAEWSSFDRRSLIE